MFHTVTLENSFGDLVHRGKLPPFNHQPGVILWGTRYFIFWKINLYDSSIIYRETFAFALTDDAD